MGRHDYKPADSRRFAGKTAVYAWARPSATGRRSLPRESIGAIGYRANRSRGEPVISRRRPQSQARMRTQGSNLEVSLKQSVMAQILLGA